MLNNELASVAGTLIVAGWVAGSVWLPHWEAVNGSTIGALAGLAITIWIGIRRQSSSRPRRQTIVEPSDE